MPASDVLVSISDEPFAAYRAVRLSHPRLTLADLRFLPATSRRVPHGHALALGTVSLGGRALVVSADFATPHPSSSTRSVVNRVLRSVRVSRHNVLATRIPPGWHAHRALVSLLDPVERRVLTSFPLRQHRPDPNCSPSTARAQMGPDGVVIEVFESTPGLDGVRRRYFPPRQARFSLGQLADRDAPDSPTRCASPSSTASSGSASRSAGRYTATRARACSPCSTGCAYCLEQAARETTRRGATARAWLMPRLGYPAPSARLSAEHA